MDELATDAGTIEITLNGRLRSVAAGSTLSDLIALLSLQDRLVVVELNRVILARSEYPSTVLGAGDTLEIVHFVGGG